MDTIGYSTPTRKRKKLTRTQLKKIQKNMSRASDIQAKAQAYQKREQEQLPSLDDLLNETENAL